MWLIIILLLIFCFVGAPNIGPWNHGYGWGPSGAGALIVIVLLVLILSGRL